MFISNYIWFPIIYDHVWWILTAMIQFDKFYVDRTWFKIKGNVLLDSLRIRNRGKREGNNFRRWKNSLRLPQATGRKVLLVKASKKPEMSMEKRRTDIRWNYSWSFHFQIQLMIHGLTGAYLLSWPLQEKTSYIQSPVRWCDTSGCRSSWSDRHVRRLQRNNWASEESKMNDKRNCIREKTWCQPEVSFWAGMGFVWLIMRVRWLRGGWCRRMCHSNVSL